MYVQTILGKYLLIEKLGKGFFGAVYSVEDCVLHTNKAIKIMSVTNPNHAQSLFEEAAILYKCKHTFTPTAQTDIFAIGVTMY